MALRINDKAPDFTAATSVGTVNFHEWMGDGWAMLFSHPKDFTPVCATELGYVAQLSGEFAKRGCKVIGLSVDRVEDHLKWASDIEDLEWGLAQLRAGKIKPLLDRALPLSRAAEAHRLIAANAVKGTDTIVRSSP